MGMNTSETVGEISLALVAANAKLQHALKDSTNPHFKSRFASLNAHLDTIKPVYAAKGLTFVQMPGFSDMGHATLTTRIIHESGEWIEGTAGSPLQKDDPQGVGSAITYLRRYSLAAIAGIGQDDDDGNAASSGASVSGGMTIHCPKCATAMYDNRKGKANEKAPDFKCKDKKCDHAIWEDSWAKDLMKDAHAALEAGTIDEEMLARVEGVVADADLAAMSKAHHWLLTL